jgi:Glycosyltransferase family 87
MPCRYSLGTAHNREAATNSRWCVDTAAMGYPCAHPVRRRLWKWASLLALLLLTFIVGNSFLSADKAFSRKMYGHDFLPFYTAGKFVRLGQANRLYDPVATRLSEHQTVQQAGLVIEHEFGAFLNPPFAALPAAWLARWPYEMALTVWTAILCAMLVSAIVLMIRLFPPNTTASTWGLLPLLLFTWMPAWQATLHAQNTFFSLLVLAATVTFWRTNRPMLAGLASGLLLLKPQLGAVVIIALLATTGWQAAIGLAVTATALLLATLINLPGSLTDYLHRLPVNLQAIQVLPNYTWNRHITFLAFWRMLLQGHVGALPTASAQRLAAICQALVAIPLGAAIWKTRKDTQRLDRLIAAVIVATPLLLPYYMDYDLTLLSIAAVLCASDAIKNGVDRQITSAWVAFYLVMEVNAGISGHTSLIPAVPGLALLASTLVYKSFQPLAAIQSSEEIYTTQMPRALAA